MDKVTDFYFAAQSNNVAKVIKYLQDKTFDLNTPPPNVNGATALIIAIDKGFAHIVHMLLASGRVDINITWEDSRTALFDACNLGNSEIVKMLLEVPEIDVNKCMSDNRTPLWTAAQEGFGDVVRVLLTRPELDLNKCWQGSTATCPLRQAARCGRHEIVRMLWADQRLNKEFIRWTPMHLACATRDAQLFYQLIAKYDSFILVPEANTNLESEAFEWNCQDTSGFTPLHYLCAGECLDILINLIQLPEVSFQKVDFISRNPFWMACYQGQKMVVKWLLGSGKDLNLEQHSAPGNQSSSNKSADEVATLMNHAELSTLIRSFKLFPEETRKKIRREIQYEEIMTSKLLALIILLCEGYFQFRDHPATIHSDSHPNANGNEKAIRYLRLCTRLPIELQMLVSNYTYQLPKWFVSSRLLNQALSQNIARICAAAQSSI